MSIFQTTKLSAPPTSLTLEERSYANGDGQPTGRKGSHSSVTTLPQGISLPDQSSLTRTASLDRGQGGEPLVKQLKDKKRHSVFGGIFKKKKDKGDKL